MKTLATDILIIGSGFGGSAPALRFAKLGFSTIVLEKGPAIEPYQTFRQTQDPRYFLTYFKNLCGSRLSLQYIEALGGGSGFYEMVSLRAPSQVFSLKDQKSEKAWPAELNRQEFERYYGIAEKMLNIQQISDDQIPKTGHVFARIMKKCNYSVEKARYAVQNCQNSGYCITGCVYGAKQSLFMNYLPESKKYGAKIMTDMDAFAIKPILTSEGGADEFPYRYWVMCKDKKASDELVYIKTKILILSGGTIGTAKLLLASKANLPELSQQVGKNISFNGSVKAIAQLPDWCPDADMYSGRSHPGLVSYQFLEKDNVMVTAAKVLPIQFLSAARFNTSEFGYPHWGEEYTDLLKKFRHRMIILAALGIEPGTASITLDYSGNPNLYLNMSKELQDHYNKHEEILLDIFKKSGCKPMPFNYINRKGQEQDSPFFTSSHQLGSCRMADNIQKGVVDSNGEVFNYKGIYITDGAAIPSSTIVNPSLTILANSERITDKLTQKYMKYGKATNI